MKLELKKVEDPIDKAIEKLKEEILCQLNIAFEAGMEHAIESNSEIIALAEQIKAKRAIIAMESKEKEYKYDPNSSD